MVQKKRKDEKEENQTESFEQVVKALLEVQPKPKKTKKKIKTKTVSKNQKKVKKLS